MWIVRYTSAPAPIIAHESRVDILLMTAQLSKESRKTENECLEARSFSPRRTSIIRVLGSRTLLDFARLPAGLNVLGSKHIHQRGPSTSRDAPLGPLAPPRLAFVLNLYVSAANLSVTFLMILVRRFHAEPRSPIGSKPLDRTRVRVPIIHRDPAITKRLSSRVSLAS
jgi:hypothetical protein